jgi:tape measure domain-containing protein
MSLAKLVVHLTANYKGLVSGLKIAQNHLASFATGLRGGMDAIAELRKLNEELAASGEFPAKNAELLNLKLQAMQNTMDRLTDQQRRYVAAFQTKVIAIELSKQAQKQDEIRKLWQQAKSALVPYNAEAAKAVQHHKAIASNQVRPVQQSTSRAMIKYEGGGQSKTSTALQLAGIVMQAKAASSMSTAMTRARTAVSTVSTAIREVATATTTSVSVMDRFRVGLTAAKVDPSLNTLPGIIQSIASKAAGAVENFRGFGDATVAGIPAILSSVAAGMGQVMGAGDSLQATVSKLVSQFDLKKQALDRVAKIYPTSGTAVDMLKRAMDVVAPAAEQVAQKVDLANDAVRQGTIWTRNFAYLATGTFMKTGTSADHYSRGVWHALQPTRLMVFESKFAEASMARMRRMMVAVTSPVHALAMAYDRNRGEIAELRANLPPLTGGLQLGTRAFRAFAHATYFSSEVLRGIRTAATPVTWLAGKLWGLVQPAKAAKTGLDGVATGGQKAGVVLRGVTAAAGGTVTALTKVASAGAKVASTTSSSWFSALPGKAALGATAVAGLAIAMIGMGASTAMATEKSNAVFGVMMKDMEQGKAVVSALQNSKAVGLFDNEEVLNSGRLLFKAGVSAADLQGKTEQLATVAAATSTELGDLTRIYQQGANSGSFGQDKINQLAERGIDIYHALTAATGASGAELKDMISGGKIGVAEMDAALAHLTEGQGIYAGSLDVLGNTTSGMMAKIKNNIMLALGSLMGAGIATGKPFLEMLVGWSESVKMHVGAVTPILTQFTSMIGSIFTGLYSVVASIWAAIFGVGQTTMASMLGGVMEWVTKFKWYFTNLVPIAQFVWMQVALFAVSAFNDISYWITDKIPAYLTWFANNWQAVFRDIAMATVTVFTNLASNIKNAMTQIWEFIKSGGTAGLEFTWTPLLDGFQSTVAQLPDVPERAMTALEASMQSQIETIGTNLANSYDQMAASAAESMAAAAVPPEVVPLSTTPPGSQNDPTVSGADEAEKDMKQQKRIAENKAVQSRSEEGQKIAAAFVNGLKGNDDKSVRKAQMDSAKHLEKLARDSDRAPRLIVENA